MTNTLWVDFAVALGVETAAGTAGTGGRDEKQNSGNDHNNDQEEEAATVLENIVRTVFNTLPEIDYLVMSLPGEQEGKGKGAAAPTPKFLLRAFEVLSRHANASPNNLDEAYGKPLLLLCDRMAFLPTLAVRKSDVWS